MGELFSSGSPKVVSRVKNPKLQGGLDDLYTDYTGLKANQQQTLDDYISKYLKATKQAETNTAQEQAALDQYYNGGLEQRLTNLRNQRLAAATAAADTAVGEALRGVKSNIGGTGSGSSYEDRLAMGAVLPIRTGVALQNADMARGDLDYLLNAQRGLLGARTGLADALAGRALVPYGVRANMFGQNLGAMNSLLGMDQLNHFYGLQQDPSLLSQITGGINQVSDLFNAGSGLVGSFGRLAGSFTPAGATINSLGGFGFGSAPSPGGSGNAATAGTSFKFSHGGMVRGPGDDTSDSIPVMLSDEEYVIPAAATRIPGVLPLLDRIRRMGLALTPPTRPIPGHMATGGFYADSFGGLTRADQGQQSLDLARQGMLQREREFEAAQEQRAAEYATSLAEARRREDNLRRYQDEMLQLNRDYLAQGGAGGSRNNLAVATEFGDDPTQGKDPAVAAAAAARRNELKQAHDQSVADSIVLNKVEQAKRIKAAAEQALKDSQSSFWSKPAEWANKLFGNMLSSEAPTERFSNIKGRDDARALLQRQLTDADAIIQQYGPRAVQLQTENAKSGRFKMNNRGGFEPAYVPPFLQSTNGLATPRPAMPAAGLPRPGSGMGDLRRAEGTAAVGVMPAPFYLRVNELMRAGLTPVQAKLEAMREFEEFAPQ